MCASPQARQYFPLCCKSDGVPVLELIKWVWTVWGSMHDLVEWFTKCKVVFQNYFLSMSNFIQIFKGHPEVLSLCWWKAPEAQNKKYSEYQFESGKWDILGLIQEVLAVHFPFKIYFFSWYLMKLGIPWCPSILFIRDWANTLEDHPLSWIAPNLLGDYVRGTKVFSCQGRNPKGPWEIVKMVQVSWWQW